MPNFTEMSEKQMWDYFETHDGVLTRTVIIEKFSPSIVERRIKKNEAILIGKISAAAAVIAGSRDSRADWVGWEIKMDGRPFSGIS
jgi:hypothetical protein